MNILCENEIPASITGVFYTFMSLIAADVVFAHFGILEPRSSKLVALTICLSES